MNEAGGPTAPDSGPMSYGTTGAPAAGSPIGASPPTVRLPEHMLPVLPPRPTAWPTVLGILAIVFGSLGVMMYGCGTIGAFIAPLMTSSFSQFSGQTGSMMQSQMQVQSQYMWWQVGANAASLGLAVLLLCAGIGLIQRRSWTRSGLLWWAVLRMIVAVVTTLVQYQLNEELFDAMQKALAEAQQQSSAGGTAATVPAMPAGFFGMMRGLGYVGIAISMLWYCALPVFVLIWFNRRRIKAEVASWRAR